MKRFDPLRDFTAHALAKEIKSSVARVESVFSSSAWNVLWARSKLGGWEKWAFLFVGLLLIITVQKPLRGVLMRIEANCDEGTERCYRGLAAYLIRNSLPLLSLTFFFGIFYFFRFFGIHKSFWSSLFNVGLERVLFLIFLILTTTRWGLDYLRHTTTGTATPLLSFLSIKLRRFFLSLRTFLIAGVILVWIVGSDALIPWMLKSLAFAFVLVWTVFFWRGFRRVSDRTAREGHAVPDWKWIAFLRTWTFLVVGGSLALNLLGYRSLGGQWFVSWADTAILLFWGWIGLKALGEWGRDLGSKTGEGFDHPETSSRHFRWSLFHFTRAAFFLIFAAAIVHVRDPAGIMRAHLVDIFGFTLAVGSLQLSVKGILFAGVIVFATLVGARVGRSMIKEKVLGKRSFERGLEDSILTITSYLIWTLGILLALGTLGVDASSLAVVFGALSIGIGFGRYETLSRFFISNRRVL